LAELTYARVDNASGQCGMSTKLPEESPRGITDHHNAKSWECLFLQQLFTVKLTIKGSLQPIPAQLQCGCSAGDQAYAYQFRSCSKVFPKNLEPSLDKNVRTTWLCKIVLFVFNNL
jgi:hypothetical protein